MEDVLFLLILKWEETPRSLTTGINILVAFIVGANGNAWYFERAQGVIESVRAEQLPEDQHLAELTRRGGTHLLAGLGWMALYVVLFIALYAAFAMAVGLDGK